MITAAVAELKRLLLTRELHDQLCRKVAERIQLMRHELGGGERRLEARVAQLKDELDRLVAFVRTLDSTSSGAMDALRSSLEETGREHRDAVTRLEAVRRAGGGQVRLPTVEEFTALCLDIEARLKSDPTAAREALRRMLADGRLVMEPLPDGSYRAHGVILAVSLPSTGNKKPRQGAGPTGASSGNDGCAGRI